MAWFKRSTQDEERARLAAIDTTTWRDSDGNPIAPLQNEYNQQWTDETFAEMLREAKKKK